METSRAGMRWKLCKESKIIRRQAKLAQRLAPQLAQGLHLQVAPGATRLASLGSANAARPVMLPGQLASSFAAAAGGQKGCVARLVPLDPAKEACTFGIVAQPIQTQLDGRGFAKPQCEPIWPFPRPWMRLRRAQMRLIPAPNTLFVCTIPAMLLRIRVLACP